MQTYDYKSSQYYIVGLTRLHVLPCINLLHGSVYIKRVPYGSELEEALSNTILTKLGRSFRRDHKNRDPRPSTINVTVMVTWSLHMN